jgi:hypothetical protein
VPAPRIDFQLWDAAVPLAAQQPRWIVEQDEAVVAIGLPRGVNQSLIAAEPGVVVWTWVRGRDGRWPTFHVIMEFVETLVRETGSSAVEVSRQLRAISDGPGTASLIQVADESLPATRYDIADGRWLVRASLRDADIVTLGNHVDVPTLRPATMTDWTF